MPLKASKWRKPWKWWTPWRWWRPRHSPELLRSANSRLALRIAGLKVYALVILYLLFLSTEPRSLDKAFLFTGREETRPQKMEAVAGRFAERLAPYDGQWYLDISEKGYRKLTRPERLGGWLPEGNYAFFPLLPALLRTLGAIFGSLGLEASLLLLFALSCAGYLAIVRISTLAGGPGMSVVLLMLAYPAAVFQCTLYTEGLFIFLSGITLLHALRGRAVSAAAFGMLAGLCRPQGILLALPIWMELRKEHGSLRALVPAAAPLSGFLAMTLISWQITESPLGFVSIQESWGRSGDALNLATSFREVFSYRGPPVDLLGIALGLGLLIPMWRRLPRSLAAFGTAMVIMPLLTGSLLSFGRFLSVSIPHFLVLAILLENKKTLRRAVLAIFVVAQVLLAKGLIAWHFVG